MRFGYRALWAATLIAIIGSGLAFWGWTSGNCAEGRPAPAKPAVKHTSLMVEWSELEVPSGINYILTPANNPGPSYANSVTLSPDDTRLAVVSRVQLLVRDLRSNRWIRNFGEAHVVAARWHPTEPVLIAADGSADQPNYYLAYLLNGKRHQIFRGDANPVAWTKAGLIAQPAGNVDSVIVTVDIKKARVRKSGKFGHKIPWAMHPKAFVRYMSPAGPNDQVAAELEPMDENLGLPPHWMEMYRRVPGQKQWVRTGMVKPGIKGKTMVWYPRNPNWLGDGRLAYLRIYPAEWMPFRTTGSRQPDPRAWTARNRAELWMCDATGANQKKITTIWDLRPFDMNPVTDWITVDRQGKNVYYLSGKVIRHFCLASK